MPRIRLALALAVALAVTQPVFAQTANEKIAQLCPSGAPDSLTVMTGIVRDAVTREPAANARVRLATTGAPEFTQSWIEVDDLSGYVNTGTDGTYAVCGVPGGSRITMQASHGDRLSRFVGLFFVSGGVSTGNEFYPVEARIWHQDLELLPRQRRTAVLVGQVTDAATTPVPEAEVRLLGSGLTTSTDPEGRFSFHGLAPGDARLAVIRLGFRRLERDFQLIAGDTTDLTTASLEHLPIRLAELTVTAEAQSPTLQEVGFYDRRKLGASSNFVTMAEYRARRGDPVLTTEVLYTMRGLRPRSVLFGEGLGYQTVGLVRCDSPPALFVDGFYVGTAAERDVNFLVPTDWLEAVEVHRERPIAKVGFTPKEGCGAIYFWTKPLASVPEEDIPVDPGARVRVTAPTEALRRYVGVYVAGNRDTVYVRGDADARALAIPLDAVTLLELRTGEKRRRLRGAGVGLAVGAIVGAISGVPNENKYTSALVLAVPGSFVGFLVGSLLKTDRWEETVPTLLVGGLSRREARFGLAGSFRF